MTSITVPTLGTEECPHSAKVTTFHREANGDLAWVETVGCNGDDEARQKTVYTYDAHGQLESVDGPRDNSIDATDVTTFLYYPDLDDPEDEVDIPDNNLGRLEREIDAAGNPTIYADYDYFGNAQTVTDPNGVVTTRALNFKDQVTEQHVDPAGEDFVTQYKYDLVGNLELVRLPKCVDAGLVACPFSYHYEYDGVNRVIEIEDALGNQIGYTYDTEGNRTREEFRSPGPSITRFTNFAYDDLNRLQYVYFTATAPESTGAVFYKYMYYADGMLKSERDPENHTTMFEYDALKHLSSVTQPGSIITRYGYGAQDNLELVTDPRGLQTIYTSGDLGWRLKTVSPDTGSTTYEYDLAGNLKKSTDANGVLVERSYDELNRLTATRYPDSSLNVTNEYDSSELSFGIGRRATISDPSGTTSYSYDQRGMLTSEEKEIDGLTFVTGYDYDRNGNLIELRYPSIDPTTRQGAVDYHYDEADRIDEVSILYNGDPIALASEIGYKPFGPRTSTTLGNGLVDARTFDTRYQLGTWTVGNASVGNVLNYTHAFNNDGNLRTITDNLPLPPTISRSFDYDDLHRLTSAEGPWGAGIGCSGDKTYAYDLNGNRTCNGEAGTTNYVPSSSSNRLESSTGATYDYDSNGNVTSDGTHTYGYSDANRLVMVDEGTTTYSFSSVPTSFLIPMASYRESYRCDLRRLDGTGARCVVASLLGGVGRCGDGTV